MNFKTISKQFKVPQKVLKKIAIANNFSTKIPAHMNKLYKFIEAEYQKAQIAMRAKIAEFNNKQDDISS